MADLLRVVSDRMAELGWNKMRLVRELKGKRVRGGDIPQATVYQFLQGTKRMDHEDLGVVLDVLGITLTVRADDPPRRKRTP